MERSHIVKKAVIAYKLKLKQNVAKLNYVTAIKPYHGHDRYSPGRVFFLCTCLCCIHELNRINRSAALSCHRM